MARLIFGCGYLGRRVARRWLDAGDEVYAVTRREDRAAELAEAGLRPIVGDVTRPETLGDLPQVRTAVYAVGYDRSSEQPMRTVYVDGLTAALNSVANRTQRFIYISSTGVYGQTDGDWIDEDSPCHPTRESGRVCLEAEGVLREHPLSERSVILRLAGIYGPGRLPNRKALTTGEPIATPPDGYLNLIHVDDAATAVLAAEAHLHPSPSSLYLISDGHPVPRRDYYAEAARLLGAPPPRFAAPHPAAPKTARGASNRRVRNARMLSELGVRLEYPSYREGLAAAFA